MYGFPSYCQLVPQNICWVLKGMNIPCPLLGEDGWKLFGIVWMEEWKNGVLVEKILYM